MAKAKKKKAKAKAKTKASTKRSSGKKAVKKKAIKKKAIKKKAVKRPARAAAKKKAKKKSVSQAKRKASRSAPKRTSAAAKEKKLEKQLLIEPGPPAGSIPPVEEPAQHEEAIGVVTHYYSHLGVAVVQINKDALRSGDQVRIKGHTTDFTQAIDSMEYEHQHVDEATAGQSVGLKVVDHAREHDILYVIR